MNWVKIVKASLLIRKLLSEIRISREKLDFSVEKVFDLSIRHHLLAESIGTSLGRLHHFDTLGVSSSLTFL